jgi:hypothetical protein
MRTLAESMDKFAISAIAVTWLLIGLGCWLGWRAANWPWKNCADAACCWSSLTRTAVRANRWRLTCKRSIASTGRLSWF